MTRVLPNPLRAQGPLVAPPDVDAAYRVWGANCGPTALAAALRRTVEDVRPLLTAFDRKRYVNASDMHAALRRAGIEATWSPPQRWPSYGLAVLQIGGPWTAPGLPVGAALRHTHWVAVQRVDGARLIYDGNAASWLDERTWREAIMAAILDETPRTDRRWWARTGLAFRDPREAVGVVTEGRPPYAPGLVFS